MASSRILITGGGGFIGSHLLEALIKDHEIVVLDSFRRNALQYSAAKDHAKLTMVQGDIRDAAVLKRATDGCDVVIHCAAIAGIESVGVDALETLDVNLGGTRCLLEAVKEKKLKRFVQFSTSEVYGPYIYKGTENDLTSQGPLGEVRWAYSVSKLAAEHLAFAYRGRYGLPVTSVRPFNIYGPRQVGEGAIQKFIANAVSGQDLTINGDGAQIRAWCFITDFVDGVLRCVRDEKAVGEAFNIGTPQAAVSTSELARLVTRLSQSKSAIKHRKATIADVEVRVPSIEKAQRLLGFDPKIDLADGIQRTLAWYKDLPKAS